jgi:hypothetical protein
MKKLFVITIIFLFSFNAFAQRSEKISKEKLIELFNQDYDFWRWNAYKLLLNVRSLSIEGFYLDNKLNFKKLSDLNGLDVKSKTCNKIKVTLFNSEGEPYDTIVNEFNYPQCMVLNQSVSSINIIGLGWIERNNTGMSTDNAFYYTFNTDIFSSLKDKRRLFFLKLLSNKEFVNSLKPGLSVISEKNNKESLVVIDFQKNAIDSSKYDFLNSLANWAFEKYDKQFSQAYYGKNVKNYYISSDKDYNTTFKSQDPDCFIEVAVYDKNGNFSVKKHGNLEYMPINEILLSFGRVSVDGNKRELYMGASKLMSTYQGISIGYVPILLKLSDFKKKTDLFNDYLSDYLMSIYE